MKQRLDQLLVELGFFSSRTQAQAAIMAGQVYVNGQKSDKAGKTYPSDVQVEIKGQPHPYVGRGGLKLERALDEFKIAGKDRIAVDIGASTGGFTDCLLQRGAARVYAVDVGYGQLAWKLRQDQRVKTFERTNARNLKLKDLGLEKSDITLAVIDVSFISLAKILPAVYNLLADQAEIIALIKPQFEAKREQVGKGGIVRDEAVRKEVVTKVTAEAQALGLVSQGLIESPIKGADGNVEFLAFFKKQS